MIRVLWIVPRLGTRTAELLEAPLMRGVSIVAARGVLWRLAMPQDWPHRPAVGV